MIYPKKVVFGKSNYFDGKKYCKDMKLTPVMTVFSIQVVENMKNYTEKEKSPTMEAQLQFQFKSKYKKTAES
jgi:hypothetical protein